MMDGIVVVVDIQNELNHKNTRIEDAEVQLPSDSSALLTRHFMDLIWNSIWKHVKNQFKLKRLCRNT